MAYKYLSILLYKRWELGVQVIERGKFVYSDPALLVAFVGLHDARGVRDYFGAEIYRDPVSRLTVYGAVHVAIPYKLKLLDFRSGFFAYLAAGGILDTLAEFHSSARDRLPLTLLVAARL